MAVETPMAGWLLVAACGFVIVVAVIVGVVVLVVMLNRNSVPPGRRPREEFDDEPEPESKPARRPPDPGDTRIQQ